MPRLAEGRGRHGAGRGLGEEPRDGRGLGRHGAAEGWGATGAAEGWGATGAAESWGRNRATARARPTRVHRGDAPTALPCAAEAESAA